jgi:hypothetical protein
MTKPKKKGASPYIDTKSGDDTTSSGQEFCRICSAPKGKKSFIEHHIQYEPPHTIYICRSCHSIIHAQAPVFNHRYKRLFDRASWFPIFAIRYLVVLEEELGIGYIKNISMEGEK